MAEQTTQARSTVRDLNTPHLFTPPTSREAWEARVAELRTQILFSAGLWPMPEKSPLRPQVTGRVEGPDYTIENVALQTLPGFYLCGNRYRPKASSGPFPAIVNPHGHWKNGRREMEEDVPRACPPPSPPAPGKGNLVSIGVNLARQGFVVFAYDMVGYNDTLQVGHDFARGLEPWSHGVSLLGLQLWNSIRVVDYLESLPDVDATRIGATGASGGGTQVFLLTAVDDRIRAAVPVNMVSAHMQGGCLCENAPGLRLETDNAEIAAMMAPKPLLLVACTGDWTKDNPEVEWPAIRKVYDLYDAADRTAVCRFNYGHNYNIESREAMYAWFGRWLRNDPDLDRCRERPFEVDPAALRVWTEAHPAPADALPEAELTRSLISVGEPQLAARWPRDAASLESFRTAMTPALRHALGVRPIPRASAEEVAPAGRYLLLAALETDAAAERQMRETLAARGYNVFSVSLAPIAMDAQALWAEFYSCYNPTPLGKRVGEIAGWLASLQARCARPVDVVGLGEAGLWTLLARALVPADARGEAGKGSHGRTVVDAGGLDTSAAAAYVGTLYAPGLRRAGDFRTAAMLVAPASLCLQNTGSAFPTEAITAGFRGVGAELRVEKERLSEAEVAAWLVDAETE